jgi:hypothetical protein
MRALNDATGALIRALRAALPADVVIEEIRSRSWASITFSGARHDIAVRLPAGEDEAANLFVAGLDPTAFTLRGHLLASIGLKSDERGPEGIRLGLEALTVEDA